MSAFIYGLQVHVGFYVHQKGLWVYFLVSLLFLGGPADQIIHGNSLRGYLLSMDKQKAKIPENRVYASMSNPVKSRHQRILPLFCPFIVSIKNLERKAMRVEQRQEAREWTRGTERKTREKENDSWPWPYDDVQMTCVRCGSDSCQLEPQSQSRALYLSPVSPSSQRLQLWTSSFLMGW